VTEAMKDALGPLPRAALADILRREGRQGVADAVPWTWPLRRELTDTHHPALGLCLPPGVCIQERD
jgi:hypothetical protein